MAAGRSIGRAVWEIALVSERVRVWLDRNRQRCPNSHPGSKKRSSHCYHVKANMGEVEDLQKP